MQKYGITAEQAGDGSPDVVWLLKEGRGEARPYTAGDRLDVGVEAFPGQKPNDMVLWAATHRAVIAGDTLVDFGQGLHINPRWLDPDMTREQVVEGLRPLLDLPVEHVLATHGGPSTGPPSSGRSPEPRGGAGRYGSRVIEEGTPAPDFELESDDDATVRLSELRGRPVVLYFYPKDDTPGCTKQACGFRDLDEQFAARGAVVLGVSPDDAASHRRFKEKYDIPFTLLADPDHRVAEEYGAWGEQTYKGRRYLGIKRSTFVIDGDGVVAKAMYGVNPKRNPGEVLAALPEPAQAR